MTTTTHPAVAEYLSRVEAALADLPASEVEEIVEDIGQHLSELAGELGEEVSVESLTDRLGTPEQYAAELRTAAGYLPAEPSPSHGSFWPRYAFWALVLTSAMALLAGLANQNVRFDPLLPLVVLSLPLLLAVILVFKGRVSVAAVAALPECRAFARAGRRIVGVLSDRTVAYLRSLRPAWWLIRVVMLIAALLLAIDGGTFGNFLLPLIALTILAWGGAKARTDGRWRWVVAPVNLFTVGLTMAIVGSGWAGLTNPGYHDTGYEPSPVQCGPLFSDGGADKCLVPPTTK